MPYSDNTHATVCGRVNVNGNDGRERVWQTYNGTGFEPGIYGIKARTLNFLIVNTGLPYRVSRIYDSLLYLDLVYNVYYIGVT